MKTKRAAWAGFDLSTTGLGLGVRSPTGQEAFVTTKMQGATRWKGQPAFELAHVPAMIGSLLATLEQEGWRFQKTALSFSVRQHDMVLLDRRGEVLMPALSWQCNAAKKEVLELRKQGAEQGVGRIEERFILPKLIWALRQDRALRGKVAQVMTTGDWIAQMLTGKPRLSTSDAISNGLLVQKTKKRADPVIGAGRLKPTWFPNVIQSGRVVGTVRPRPVQGASDAWLAVKKTLSGGKVIAGLGDNHATGVGCGLEAGDYKTIVVSAGTSGTINRVASTKAGLAGGAACFEFYEDRMLLLMLADCCAWYDRFVARFAPKHADKLDELNALIAKADLSHLRRVLHAGGKEHYPPNWSRMSLGERAASTQFSIMLELLLLLRSMLAEVQGATEAPVHFVLTGGLSRSKFFQQVFSAGVRLLAPGAKVLTSARKGPMRYQTAVYGALLNAMRPQDRHAAGKLCPTRASARPDANSRAALAYLLQAAGL